MCLWGQSEVEVEQDAFFSNEQAGRRWRWRFDARLMRRSLSLFLSLFAFRPSQLAH